MPYVQTLQKKKKTLTTGNGRTKQKNGGGKDEHGPAESLDPIFNAVGFQEFDGRVAARPFFAHFRVGVPQQYASRLHARL